MRPDHHTGRSVIHDPDDPLGHDDGMDDRMWSLIEAAERTGTSRSTLQRLATTGKIAGATKQGRGWKLPTSGIIGAGLTMTDPQPASREHRDIERDIALADARREADQHRERADALQRELHRADQQINDYRRILNSRLLELAASGIEHQQATADDPIVVGQTVTEVKRPGRFSIRRLKRTRAPR
jgi:excisionase family DNA binding protein